METNPRFLDVNSHQRRTVPPPGWNRGRYQTPENSNRWVQNSASGFTLIELLVVMVIIGLLGALVAPRLFKNVAKSKITAAKAQIANFQTALGAYRLDVGTFPSTDEGLQALRVAPLSAKNWEGPYLPKEIPPDPWGNPYIYKYPGEHGDEPDIISLGADGREGGEGENGDIYSWK
ncbi:MAG TPA: type II secretion system major pseudopilin GspG [Terriglobia bacterium]|nr:type II secretion system major pseudopilin GspG [Terriglobia bacterium]